jgi:cyclic beta-1,2-glucan synthetase
VVKAFMAHHQGMTVVALDNALNVGGMRTRFHDVPAMRATELLLQERTPRDIAVSRPRVEEIESELHVRELVPRPCAASPRRTTSRRARTCSRTAATR